MRTETVAIIYQHPKILLGLKKNKFGTERYNGFGGGVEKGETLEMAVIRETMEEAGIRIIKPVRYGEILVQFDCKEQDHFVHFFRVEEFSGIPRESEEMIPEWFYIKDIPYKKMWEDDKYWLPMLLDGKKFTGRFYFSKDFTLNSYKLTEIDKL